MKYFTLSAVALISVTLFAACQPATPTTNETQQSTETAIPTQEETLENNSTIKITPEEEEQIRPFSLNGEIIENPQSYIKEQFGMSVALPEGWMAYIDTRGNQYNPNNLYFLSPKMMEWRKENWKNCELWKIRTKKGEDENTPPCLYEAVITNNGRLIYNPEENWIEEGTKSEVTINGTTYTTFLERVMGGYQHYYITQKNGNTYRFKWYNHDEKIFPEGERFTNPSEFLQWVTFED